MRISDWSSDVCSSDLQDHTEPLARDRTARRVGDQRGIILARLPFIGVHGDAVGIGAPGTADRTAVGHAAAADQADAVVAFARDRPAVFDRGADCKTDELVVLRVLEIAGGDPRAGARTSGV